MLPLHLDYDNDQKTASTRGKMNTHRIFLLCSLLLSDVGIVNAFTGLEIIGAVSGAISAGSSLAGTTINALMNDGYRVTCGIEVENWTKFPLVKAITRLKGGEVSVPPNAVLPGTKEAMITHKTGYTATGVYGTVSWLIQGKHRRIAVMWSAPFNFDHHSNWLAVGLTSVGVVDHGPGNTWFDQMYYGKDNNNLRFRRHRFSGEAIPVIYSDDDFEVVGTMGTTHKPHVKIVFAPLNKTNLARQFQKKSLPK